jgi:hypothetical protein
MEVLARGAPANGASAAPLGEDANVLMLIQVPLKFRAPRPAKSMATGSSMADGYALGGGKAGAAPMQQSQKAYDREESDVDVAVLGHGETEGPYTELDDLTIERDGRFPVRVTVQFYQATSNGVVSSADIGRMAKQIKAVYKKGDYVGSLVVPSPADKLRPTNWEGVSTAPDGWVRFAGIDERYINYGGLWFPESAVTGVVPRAQPQPQGAVIAE